MKTYILLPNVNHGDFLPELFIDHFTKPGDTVFDPFAGYGTTLLIAEKLGRKVRNRNSKPNFFVKVMTEIPHGKIQTHEEPS